MANEKFIDSWKNTNTNEKNKWSLDFLRNPLANFSFYKQWKDSTNELNKTFLEIAWEEGKKIKKWFTENIRLLVTWDENTSDNKVKIDYGGSIPDHYIAMQEQKSERDYAKLIRENFDIPLSKINSSEVNYSIHDIKKENLSEPELIKKELWNYVESSKNARKSFVSNFSITWSSALKQITKIGNDLEEREKDLIANLKKQEDEKDKMNMVRKLLWDDVVDTMTWWWDFIRFKKWSAWYILLTNTIRRGWEWENIDIRSTKLIQSDIDRLHKEAEEIDRYRKYIDKTIKSELTEDYSNPTWGNWLRAVLDLKVSFKNKVQNWKETINGNNLLKQVPDILNKKANDKKNKSIDVINKKIQEISDNINDTEKIIINWKVKIKETLEKIKKLEEIIKDLEKQILLNNKKIQELENERKKSENNLIQLKLDKEKIISNIEKYKKKWLENLSAQEKNDYEKNKNELTRILNEESKNQGNIDKINDWIKKIKSNNISINKEIANNKIEIKNIQLKEKEINSQIQKYNKYKNDIEKNIVKLNQEKVNIDLKYKETINSTSELGKELNLILESNNKANKNLINDSDIVINWFKKIFEYEKIGINNKNAVSRKLIEEWLAKDQNTYKYLMNDRWIELEKLSNKIKEFREEIRQEKSFNQLDSINNILKQIKENFDSIPDYTKPKEMEKLLNWLGNYKDFLNQINTIKSTLIILIWELDKLVFKIDNYISSDTVKKHQIITDDIVTNIKKVDSWNKRQTWKKWDIEEILKALDEKWHLNPIPWFNNLQAKKISDNEIKIWSNLDYCDKVDKKSLDWYLGIYDVFEKIYPEFNPYITKIIQKNNSKYNQFDDYNYISLKDWKINEKKITELLGEIVWIKVNSKSLEELISKINKWNNSATKKEIEKILRNKWVLSDSWKISETKLLSLI